MLEVKPSVPMSPEQLAKRQQFVNDMNLQFGKNWAFSRSQPPAPRPPVSPGLTTGARGRKTYPPGRLGELLRKRDVAVLTADEEAELERLITQSRTPSPQPRPQGGFTYSLPPLVPRQAAAESSQMMPYTQQSIGRGVSMMVPNAAWGDANGMVWSGQGWQRRDPNEDLQRRMLEMEVEKRQQEIAHEAWKRSQEKVATEWALNQQMHPQNQGGVPMIQRDSDGDGIDNNGIPMYGDQPKRRRRPVPEAGRAQPVLPPDQGTPYGAPMPAQPQRMAPASDYDMFRPRNMLPESGRAGQFMPPGEELAWMEKNLKEMEAALAAGNTAVREDVVRLRRVIAELKGGQAGGSAPQAGAGSQTPILRAWNDPSNPRYAGRPPFADGSRRLF